MISIIIPTYNRAALLPRAIDSVLRQSYADWEIIAVDDGSTDETMQVLAGYEDPRVRMVRHTENRGVTAAENTGFDEIRGEWFTLLGDDDELVPDALEVLSRTAEETGAGAITCNCSDSRTGELTGHGWYEDGWKELGDLAEISGEHWGITKTSLLGDLRFDERLPGLEGTLWAKITMRAGRRYYVHRPLRIYHSDSSDRVTVRARTRTLAEIVRIDLLLGEDTEYVATMRSMDLRRYWALRMRILAARLVNASRVLSLPGLRRARPRHVKVVSAAMVLVAVVLTASRLGRRVRRVQIED